MTHNEWKKRADELQRQITAQYEGEKYPRSSTVTKTPDGMKNQIISAYLFENVRKEGQRLYRALDENHSRIASELETMRKTYVPQVVLNKQAELEEEEKVKIAEYAKSFKGLVDRAVKAREDAITEMLAVPPTNEQLNLLQALQMQGKNIEAVELNLILPQLIGNYRAMRTLKGIAENAGLTLTIPPQFDYQVLSEHLEWVKKYLSDRCHDLSAYNGKINHPLGRCFFGNFDDIMYRTNAVEIFDCNMQIQTPTRVTVNNRTLSDDERAIVEHIAECDPRSLKSKLNEAAKSPELRKLISLHPEYRALLDPVNSDS